MKEEIKLTAISIEDFAKLKTGDRTKHTPGPWHCEQDLDQDYTAIGEPIAIVGGEECVETVRFVVGRFCDYGPHGEQQTAANARLIAAAPELLAACEAVVSDCREVLEGRESMSMDLIHAIVNGKARAAIAKATGR